jgi:RNA recognition motif-containing protein
MQVRLFVSNIPFVVDEDTLVDIIEERTKGFVISCFMPIDRSTGERRGFAYVMMPEEDAKNAIRKLDGYELEGRALRVAEARAKKENEVLSIREFRQNSCWAP